MYDTFLSVLIGCFVVCLGWVVTHFLTLRRTDDARRKENALRHIENQIKEAYGPLLGLIEHSEDIYNVARRLLPGPLEDSRKNLPRFSNKEAQIWDFFVKSYFIPIHENVRSLLSSKTHLLEKNELPTSFREFLNYAADLECRHKLYLKRNIDTSSLPGVEYPYKFKKDIQETLQKLHNRQQQLLRKKNI